MHRSRRSWNRLQCIPIRKAVQRLTGMLEPMRDSKSQGKTVKETPCQHSFLFLERRLIELR